MSDNDIYVSQSEFTRKWNLEFPDDTVSRQYVSKLVSEGTFEKSENRKIPYNKCKNILIEKKKNVEREAQRKANKKKKEENKENLFKEEIVPEKSVATMSGEEKEEYEKKILELEKEPDKKDTEDSEGLEIKDLNDSTFNDVKKFKEYYQGLQAKLNYEKESGEYVKREEVERAAFEVAQLTKNKLLTIPARVAAVVASMNDKREVQGYIYDEIYNALSELGNEC